MTTATYASRSALFALLSITSALHSASADEPPTPAQPTDDSARKSAPSAVVGEPAGGQADGGEEAAELDALERELAQVMDELVAARARVGVLSRVLFSSPLAVEVVRRADELRLAQLTLRLDGVPVHEGDGSALASERALLFTGYVAPGMHELAFEHTERAKAGEAFGYTRSERYRIAVKKGQRTHVELIVRDDSDIAEQAAEDDDGDYHVETELRVSHRRARD